MAVAVGAVLKQRRPQIVKLKWHRSSLSRSAETRGPVMTFQAHSEYHGTSQQPRVGRSVGIMANFAAFHANRRVLINKGSALFLVTLDASLLAAHHLFHHGGPRGISPCGSERTVRVVAIAAVHDSFVDAVLERHGELRTNIGVAFVAQLRLHFRQQELGRGGAMDGVTIGAYHIVFSVGGAPDVGAGESLGMAAQAVVQNPFWFELGKSNDCCLSAESRDVSLPRAVAALASGMFGRLLACGGALEMWVLKEFRRNVGMTGFAGLAAYEAAAGIFRGQRRWLLG